MKKITMRHHFTVIFTAICFIMMTTSHSQTMEEIHELQKAQLAKKLKDAIEKDNSTTSSLPLDANAPNNPAMTKSGKSQRPLNPDTIKDMQLTGLFGVGNEAEAKIAYRGELFERKIGMELAGWTLTGFNNLCVVMAKTDVNRTPKDVDNLRTESLCIKTLIRDYAVEKNASEIAANAPRNVPGSPMVPPIQVGPSPISPSNDSNKPIPLK